MPTPLSLLFYAAPLLLCLSAVTGMVERGRAPGRVLAITRIANLATLASAFGALALAILHGASVSPLITSGPLEPLGLGLSIRIDAVSVTLFLVVALVGTLVSEYARTYLDGDPRHGAFMGRLCLTLASVHLLILSGNLFQFALAWIGMSVTLHGLLVFYPERVQAVLAARKKFIFARIGDVLVLVAFFMLVNAAGTGDIGTLLTMAREGDLAPGMATAVAAVCLALAALLKSAQIPTHGWLTEVMETPTPVSALLHAGIVNAGGFLIIRFADIAVLHTPSLTLLAIVGGATALFGSIVMLTQTSVKVSLAYSTVAQMGFMLLQCGLGAFSSALVHIVAHSLYKAHAFLSSGSVVDLKRAAWTPGENDHARPGLRLMLGLLLALPLAIGVGILFGLTPEEKPAIVALGAILVLGLTHLLSEGLTGRPSAMVIGRTIGAAVLVSVLYFGLQKGALLLLGTSVPDAPAQDGLSLAVLIVAVVSFTAVTLVQGLALGRLTSPFWRAAYVAVSNDLYINAAIDHMLGSLRKRNGKPAPTR